MRASLVAMGVLVLLAATRAPAAAPGGAAQGGAARPLIVAVAEVPPFAIAEDDGSWSGLSIELWRRIASDLGLRWEFRAVSLAEVDGLLRDHAVDLALGAIAISATGEGLHDYSYSYLTTGLGFAERPHGRPSWRTTLESLADSGLLSIMAAIAVAILVIGILITFLERRRSSGDFGGSLPRGIATGVWWAAVTMTTVGYGDATPKTAPGRSLALLWMFVGVAAVSIFTATITSVLTVGSLLGAVRRPDDLLHVRLAAIAVGPAAGFLERHHLTFSAHTSIEGALAALAEGEVDATLGPVPALRYFVSRRWQGVLRVSPIVIEPIRYAIGLPPDSPLRKSVDRALLRITESDGWRDVEHQYLGRP